MRLPTEFIQLPVRFDAQQLAREVLQFSEAQWSAHHQGYVGNSALALVSPNGDMNNEHTGPMRGTEILENCSYIQQILASFNTVIGRSRLMRLAPNSKVPPHFDINVNWRRRVRIHIPIITDPGVIFSSLGNQTETGLNLHMRAGDAWIFDNWQTHTVQNNSDIARIHLVIDTVGSAHFWNLCKQGQDARLATTDRSNNYDVLHFEPDANRQFQCERHNQTTIYSPDEVDILLHDISDDLRGFSGASVGSFAALQSNFDAFVQDWRCLWMVHGDRQSGVAHYTSLQRELLIACMPLLKITNRDENSQVDVLLDSNAAPAGVVLRRWIESAIDIDVVRAREKSPLSVSVHNTSVSKIDTLLFDNPIFIVAAPRSGSTMLFETLEENMELWTIGDESHQVFESIKALHPAANKFDSNALNASDLNDQIAATLVSSFLRKLRNSKGTMFSQIPAEAQGSSLRFLEKTPKNALRIPFIRALFPNAIFIYLHRQPEANVGSIMDAWQSGKFVTYPNLPRWVGQPWSLLLSEGWRDFIDRPLAEVAAWQWASTNRKVIDDLQKLPAASWCAISYEGFMTNKEQVLQQICTFIDIPFGPRMQALAKQQLPNSKYTLSAPAKEKWKRHEAEIKTAFKRIDDVQYVRNMIANLNNK